MISIIENQKHCSFKLRFRYAISKLVLGRPDAMRPCCAAELNCVTYGPFCVITCFHQQRSSVQSYSAEMTSCSGWEALTHLKKGASLIMICGKSMSISFAKRNSYYDHQNEVFCFTVYLKKWLYIWFVFYSIAMVGYLMTRDQMLI